jgi:hypothetical protein
VIERASVRLLEKQHRFAGHCMIIKQPISELLLWDHTKVVGCKGAKGASSADYSIMQLKAEGDCKSGWTSN